MKPNAQENARTSRGITASRDPRGPRLARVTVVGAGPGWICSAGGRAGGHAVPAGSPANVAVGLHRLERPVTLLTSWGDAQPAR